QDPTSHSVVSPLTPASHPTPAEEKTPLDLSSPSPSIGRGGQGVRARPASSKPAEQGGHKRRSRAKSQARSQADNKSITRPPGTNQLFQTRRPLIPLIPTDGSHGPAMV